MQIPTIKELFDLSHTAAGGYLSTFTYSFEALAGLREFIASLGATLSPDAYDEVKETVWVAKGAHVDPSAFLGPYTIIGEGTEVRPGAFIRGDALIGEGVVVGNSTEIKNAILFDGVQVPHYNYVGDSILGYRAHMGAGSIASNFRSDKGNITVRSDEESIETGRRKLGAALGDLAEVGCNSVLCPGSFVGRGSVVYPLSRVRGVIPARHIYKGDGSPVPMLDKLEGEEK